MVVTCGDDGALFTRHEAGSPSRLYRQMRWTPLGLEVPLTSALACATAEGMRRSKAALGPTQMRAGAMLDQLQLGCAKPRCRTERHRSTLQIRDEGNRTTETVLVRMLQRFGGWLDPAGLITRLPAACMGSDCNPECNASE